MGYRSNSDTIARVSESIGKSASVFLIGYQSDRRVKDALRSLSKIGVVSRVSILRWQPKAVWSRRTLISSISRELILKFSLEQARKRGSLRLFKLVLESTRDLGSRTFWRSLRQRKNAEISLTNKHIRCWESLMESESKFCLVVEDDILIKPQEDSNLFELLRGFLDKSDAWFASLADGYALEELGLASQTTKNVPAGYDLVSPPSTNTTAAYALNRKTAEAFLAKIAAKPSWRLLPADWMINGLLSECHVDSFFSKTPPLVNGSLTGELPSSVQT